MVHIITGKMNSGKTTALKELFQTTKRGNGIISKKYMLGSDVFGFNGYILTTGEEFPYLIHESQIQELNNQPPFIGQIGPYFIYQDAQARIEAFYKEAIALNTNPLFFDEVGKLECTNHGFYSSIVLALKKQIDIYMTVREDLIETVLNHFYIKDYQIIGR